MIHIDFQGGAHGNFLEFVCNKIAGVVTPGTSPFNNLGASHDKSYCLPQVFIAWHYSYDPDDRFPKLYNKIISIQVAPDDILPLSQISLLRAGDFGYNNNQLEIDTFNKLNTRNYRQVLDTLINSYFINQIKDSYNAVRDASWPDVNNLDDFNRLPGHIREECVQQHGLELRELSENYPDCPRHILREFFKIGFQNPSVTGFLTQQKTAIYAKEDDVYLFPFGCFYDKTEFLNEIKKVVAWAGVPYDYENEIKMLHEEFLLRQPYKDSKHRCDDIVKKIIGNDTLGQLQVTMIEEAYINAALGWDYFQGN
jgi:hypothetical protein